jgi:hypothetical protein
MFTCSLPRSIVTLRGNIAAVSMMMATKRVAPLRTKG